MTSSTLSPTHSEAPRSVATIGAALREVIAGDEAMAIGYLSELSDARIEAVLPSLSRTLGLLASVESARKAAKR